MEMNTKIYFTGLIIASVLCGCEGESMDIHEVGGVYIHARIAGQSEVETRIKPDENNDTYVAFTTGDQVGLYTDDGSEDGGVGSLRTITMDPVNNLLFTLGANGKWQDTPLLKWKTDQLDEQGNAQPSDIYGYYPYQPGEFQTGGYNIFKNVSAGLLEDVLVAERTTVENNNPAIFLTFKHRFALLKLKLGTGMEGSPVDPDGISVSMSEGIADNAKIDKGTVDLLKVDGGIEDFNPIRKHNNLYYIIIPAGKGIVNDSLHIQSINIDGKPFSFSKILIPSKNTIYNVTVHKGEEGSVALTLGGIEEWGSDRHLGSIREEGGIYWPSDVVNLTKALNKIASENRKPNKDDENVLGSYGSWDKDKGCFVFPVMRNIDMTEYADVNTRNCCINEFYGILEGNGYYINGLDVKGAGFIGTVKEGSQINDLQLKSISVDNGTVNGGTGALAGNVENGVIIHNCSVTGTSAVKGGNDTGGLVGKGNPQMDRCSSNADVTGGGNTGGLIGLLETGGSISQSYTVGTVEGSGNHVGGIAGSAMGPITNSHAGCNVKGKDYVGGLVGFTTNKISGCTATGDIVGENIVGGLVGSCISNATETEANITKSGTNGTVSGTGIVGGLIGQHAVVNDVPVSIEKSYSRSTIHGPIQGGLVGNVTKPYMPAEYETPEPTEENPDPQPVLKTPEQGTVITNCYATNGVVLIHNTNEGINYSYQIGASVPEHINKYFTIPLTISSEHVDKIIIELNSYANDQLWIKGLVMIDGKAYMLPVLNYK